MNNPEKIKQLLSPIIVAQRYLGQGKQRGNKIWYKSPFRNERTPSFMVDNKSFHDFGDGWDGDVINFIERYYNTDFLTAMKVLTIDFSLPEDEKISKELERYIKQKKEDELRIKHAINNWYNYTFTKICDELIYIQKVIPYLVQEGLKIAFDRESKLEILWDIFIDAVNNDNKKIELWKKKEDIGRWLE